MSWSTARSRWGRALAVVAVAAAAVPLAACSSSTSGSSDGPVTITFQSWVPNISTAVDAFNSAHKDIKVKLETITAGPDGGYAKMLSAVKAGNPADVAQVGYDELATFRLNDALEDITQYVGSSKDKFTEWQWDTGVFDGKVYAVPQASGPMGQFYRKDLFDAAGLKAPATWDEYYQAAKAIHAADPNHYIAAFASNQAPWLIGLAQQGGAQWFSTSGDSWKVNIDDEATQKVAAFWQKLIDEGLVKIAPDLSNEWYADLQQGNIYSWMSGSWAGAIIEGNAPDTSGKWAVAEMPQWTAGDHVSASWGGGSANAVLKGSKHPKEAAEFALWLNSDPSSVSTLNSIGAGWPALADKSAVASLQDDPKTFAFFGGQNIWETFATADKGVDTSWKWPPLVDTLYTKLTDNMKAAVQNKTPIADAYAQTQKDMVAAMKDKGISVSP
ncbi:sugar ABC transporter substrate-binding protein [Leifsonia sp. ZF2019]|uniref:ABC transporter substrate-binding protein n=1 Tax=Leifsonia sp. ZF2019 TaxID=2781978 RepID=UPI001CC1B73E|nr:sugar ABC transporter substrate-binding protein [Leifsonia sp. ZF2019]UAJ79786.1 sugar ABC transporter substrate-binding protein [Leifsonia sp. ZF2019]